MKNYINLTIYSDKENVAFARNCVALFCLRENPTIDLLDDVKTIVSEAVTNCVVHAYTNNRGKIDIECRIENGVLHIKVTDYGKGIFDIKKAVSPYYSSLDTERAGIGFTIMQSLCESFDVQNNENGGVTVCLSKKLFS